MTSDASSLKWTGSVMVTIRRSSVDFRERIAHLEGHESGAQDAIGICMSGLNRHFYDGHYWPSRIESCHDEDILSWLEEHVCLVEMFPRRPGCSVVDGGGHLALVVDKIPTNPEIIPIKIRRKY